MNATSPIESDQIPLDDPMPEMMDAPEGDALPSGPDDQMGHEPPAMDAPLGPEGGAAADAGPDLDEPKAAAGTGAITGKYNSSPVGDIQMTKKKQSYNSYQLTLSMGQLEVILNALENNHDDPVADELLATFHYYIEKLPGPGEEEEDTKAAATGKGAGEMPGEETPIPMPPGKEGGKDLANMPEPPGSAAMPPGKARMMKNAKPGLPGPDTEVKKQADHELPPPPRE